MVTNYIEGTAGGGNKVNGLVQERRSSSALAMELRLSCTNPSKYAMNFTEFSRCAFGVKDFC